MTTGRTLPVSEKHISEPYWGYFTAARMARKGTTVRRTGGFPDVAQWKQTQLYP